VLQKTVSLHCPLANKKGHVHFVQWTTVGKPGLPSSLAAAALRLSCGVSTGVSLFCAFPTEVSLEDTIIPLNQRRDFTRTTRVVPTLEMQQPYFDIISPIDKSSTADLPRISPCPENESKHRPSKRQRTKAGSDRLATGDLSDRHRNERKRSVWFAIDECDCPVEEVFHYPAVPQELVPELFWSLQEERMILTYQIKRAQEIAKKNPLVLNSIYYLHGFDFGSGHSATSKSIGDPSRILQIEASKITISDSGSRGLESFLTSLALRHRRMVVTAVLNMQQVCREAGKLEEAEGLMSFLSSHLSETPCQYAREIAGEDEHAAWSS